MSARGGGAAVTPDYLKGPDLLFKIAFALLSPGTILVAIATIWAVIAERKAGL